jgi:hypothetical protein
MVRWQHVIFLALFPVAVMGCSTTCRDGYVTQAFTHAQVYNCCSNECVRGEKACGCSASCPCWQNHHAAASKQHDQEVQARQEQQRRAQEQTAKKQDNAEVSFQFDQAKDHHLHGRYAEAMTIFKKLYFYHQDSKVAGVSAYNVACEYALMGDKGLAIEWLDNAFKHGFTNVDHVKQDKDLESIRDEPQFKKLVGE